ncbi:MAG: hypothetical protein PHG14_15720 [Desulfobacter postgatei]|uniref:hypothetical protein n=1 Tax=Desulfobacter postgatei TaxID=2293 RepID=UPI0023F190EC|nr:hypothetical protein [Desulfobacter postgatei]MDD4275164.1 hypothetical protein [Desulfobacter postgatei]
MKKIEKNGYGRGTFIDSDMFLSEAFISLGCRGTSPVTSWASSAILLMFLGKRDMRKTPDKRGNKKRLIAVNGDALSMTYAELESRGIPNKTATRGFDELLAKGFLSIVDPGGLYEKHKAVYSLSENYIRWRPGVVFETRKRDVKRGFQNHEIKSSQTPASPTHTDANVCVLNQTGTQTPASPTPGIEGAMIYDETID